MCGTAPAGGMTAVTEPLFCRTIEVRYHDADPRGAVRLTALLAYLQDAAAEHALALGVAVKDLRKLGLTWVLSRVHLQLGRLPRCGEQVTIRTWPVSRDGRFSVRDFELLDHRGERTGCATSSWAVLDLRSRRPVRIDAHLPPYPLHPVRALADPFGVLPTVDQWEAELHLPVLRGDLDVNGHVNNTIYAGWALEAVPPRVYDHAVPLAIEINFRAEVHYGDRIISRCGVVEESDTTVSLLHRIEHGDDGRELARLRSRWRLDR